MDETKNDVESGDHMIKSKEGKQEFAIVVKKFEVNRVTMAETCVMEIITALEQFVYRAIENNLIMKLYQTEMR